MQFDQQAISAIAHAKRVFVFTGAGISKESGLPTFRDLSGLWTKYDPMTLVVCSINTATYIVSGSPA